MPNRTGVHFQFKVMKFFSDLRMCAELSLCLLLFWPKNLEKGYSTGDRSSTLRKRRGHVLVSQMYTMSSRSSKKTKPKPKQKLKPKPKTAKSKYKSESKSNRTVGDEEGYDDVVQKQLRAENGGLLLGLVCEHNPVVQV
jgi:hypothetical protein